MLVFSKKAWDAMSKEDQAALMKFSKEAQQEERKLWEAYEKQAMDKAKPPGSRSFRFRTLTKRRSRTP